MPLRSTSSLHAKLQDPKYRDAFISSRVSQTIATQIRVMRQKNEMSQKDLARELGTSQNAIYRLENPRAGKPNVSTLQKIASFFRVGLVVRFAPFSEIVDWTVNISERSIDVPSFENDAGFSGTAEWVREMAKHANPFPPVDPERQLPDSLAAAKSASQGSAFAMGNVQTLGSSAGGVEWGRISQLTLNLEQGESLALNPTTAGAARSSSIISIGSHIPRVEPGRTARCGFSAREPRERRRKRYA